MVIQGMITGEGPDPGSGPFTRSPIYYFRIPWRSRKSLR